MKIKIKKITNTKMIDKKDGSGQFPVNQILTDDDEVLEVVGKVEVGQELEGEIEDTQYGKRFQKAKTGFNKFQSRQADPNTMLISYSKDIVVAFINSGKVEDEKEAAKQILNFTGLLRKAYNSLTAGKVPTEKTQETTKTPPKTDEEPKTIVTADDEEKDDISDADMDSIPF